VEIYPKVLHHLLKRRQSLWQSFRVLWTALIRGNFGLGYQALLREKRVSRGPLRGINPVQDYSYFILLIRFEKGHYRT